MIDASLNNCVSERQHAYLQGTEISEAIIQISQKYDAEKTSEVLDFFGLFKRLSKRIGWRWFSMIPDNAHVTSSVSTVANIVAINVFMRPVWGYISKLLIIHEKYKVSES